MATQLTQSQQNQMIKDNLGMVKKIASTMHRKLFNVERQDLIHWGTVGLWEAITNYDETIGGFEAYAHLRIKGHITDELRALDGISRTDRKLIKEFTVTRLKLEHQTGDKVSDTEVAQHLNVPLEKYYEVNNAENYFKSSLNSNVNEEGEELYLDIPDETSSVEEDLDKKQKVHLIMKNLEKLPEKQKFVMELVYDKGMSMIEIGEIMNLTSSRICQLHQQAIDNLSLYVRKETPLHNHHDIEKSHEQFKDIIKINERTFNGLFSSQENFILQKDEKNPNDGENETSAIIKKTVDEPEHQYQSVFIKETPVEPIKNETAKRIDEVQHYFPKKINYKTGKVGVEGTGLPMTISPEIEESLNIIVNNLHKLPHTKGKPFNLQEKLSKIIEKENIQIDFKKLDDKDFNPPLNTKYTKEELLFKLKQMLNFNPEKIDLGIDKDKISNVLNVFNHQTGEIPEKEILNVTDDFLNNVKLVCQGLTKDGVEKLMDNPHIWLDFRMDKDWVKQNILNNMNKLGVVDQKIFMYNLYRAKNSLGVSHEDFVNHFSASTLNTLYSEKITKQNVNPELLKIVWKGLSEEDKMSLCTTGAQKSNFKIC